jgi:hypothetical protein
MSKELTVEKEIALSGTKSGKIFVSKIAQPYGEKSESVASVAISLAGTADSVDWKVHIPLENLDEVIEALKNL